MNKKKKIIILTVIIIMLVFAILYFYFEKHNNIIPEGYIVVFNGGSGEITYSTYIYKIDNGHANYGFEYINATNTTVEWGSPQWNIKITGRGKITWTDEVFAVAKKNNAYSYVKLPNDKIYSIEEFRNMFIMN